MYRQPEREREKERQRERKRERERGRERKTVIRGWKDCHALLNGHRLGAQHLEKQMETRIRKSDTDTEGEVE